MEDQQAAAPAAPQTPSQLPQTTPGSPVAAQTPGAPPPGYYAGRYWNGREWLDTSAESAPAATPDPQPDAPGVGIGRDTYPLTREQYLARYGDPSDTFASGGAASSRSVPAFAAQPDAGAQPAAPDYGGLTLSSPVIVTTDDGSEVAGILSGFPGGEDGVAEVTTFHGSGGGIRQSRVTLDQDGQTTDGQNGPQTIYGRGTYRAAK